MKQLINTKELCKQIRIYGKHGLIWARQENRHFITNCHFLVRFEEIPNEVLAALFGVFYKLLSAGETVQVQHGTILDVSKPIEFSKVYLPEKQDVIGESTQFLRDFGNKLFARIIKFPSHFSLVNEEYLKLATVNDPKTTGSSAHSPIYMADGDLMVLPFRSANPQSIKELIGAVEQ